MITLAIESSSPLGSICLLEGTRTLELFTFKTNENFGQNIFPAIQNILTNHKLCLKDLGLIAVNKGPGSYTGIRVGITASNTLSWANNIPIIGVSALQCMLQNSNLTIGQNIAVSYASQGDCFVAQCILDEKSNNHYQTDKRMTWPELQAEVKGNCQVIYFSAKNGPPEWIENIQVWSPSAEFIGKSAFHLFNNEGKKEVGSVLPNYLKEFEVTPKKAKA